MLLPVRLITLAACFAVVRADAPKAAPLSTNPNVVSCGSELGQTARCNALVSDGQYRNFQAHRSPLILFDRDDKPLIERGEGDDTGEGKWFTGGGNRPFIRNNLDDDDPENDDGEVDIDTTGEGKWFRKGHHYWKKDEGSDDTEEGTDDNHGTDGEDDIGEGKWFRKGGHMWKKDDAGDDIGEGKWFQGPPRTWKRQVDPEDDTADVNDSSNADDVGEGKWFTGGGGHRTWKRVEWSDSKDAEM